MFCIIGSRFQMAELALLSTVALLEDIPEKALRRGQVGTVVETLSQGVYEIEFSDDSGQTYASIALSGSRLLPLFHGPAIRAA
jgi:hypothetical protein